MLNQETLKKYDSEKMYKIYDKWYQISEKAWKTKIDTIHLENINHIVFAGMGGSGNMGDLFNAIFSKTNIHVTVVKGYVLPKTIDKNTLIVCTSISGNTSETIYILKQIKNLNCKKIAMSCGGKIEQLCKNTSIKFFKIPMIHSPRASFTSFLYSMLQILEPILPLTKEDISNSLIEIKKLQEKICTKNLNKSNYALNIASEIIGIPIILYPHGFQAAAIRFKNSLQENAKSHIMIDNVIETCHNGIVAWEKKSNVFPILIQGQNDHIKTKERWIILKEFFKENNIKYKEIISINGNILSKLISLIYLLDYVTIYKAVLNETNPSPVKSINFIKERL